MTKIGDVQDALSTCRQNNERLQERLDIRDERKYHCDLLVHIQDRFDCGLMGVHEYMNAVADIALDLKEHAWVTR
jgi:hypothetical protein